MNRDISSLSFYHPNLELYTDFSVVSKMDLNSLTDDDVRFIFCDFVSEVYSTNNYELISFLFDEYYPCDESQFIEEEDESENPQPKQSEIQEYVYTSLSYEDLETENEVQRLREILSQCLHFLN